MNAQVQSDLITIGEGRILFGHQSVGSNVLDGVSELAVTKGPGGPRILRPDAAAKTTGPFLIDLPLGRNGDPGSKCNGFITAVRTFSGDGLDVAAMKFCHADFTRRTDVRALFEMYRRTVDSIRSAFPGIVIVHCTVPLTARTALWRRAVKWVLGRDDLSDVGNTLRLEYNDLLREHYHGEPIFDIARCESTLPDGARSSFRAGGRVVYTLAWEYASDTGHLNQVGRRVAAEEFARVIAQALSLKKAMLTTDAKPTSVIR